MVFARGAESAAVKLLALHGGVWHRERLCEALWPGEPARVVGNRIRNVLSRARAQAPGLIARGLDPVEFGVPVWVDVGEFMRKSSAAIRMAATDPRAALARGAAALDLYGGGLLHGDRYAEWAHEPREHVTARHLALLGMLADAAAATGASHLAGLYRQQAAYGDGDAPPGW